MAYDHHHHPHRYYCYHNYYWYPCYILLLKSTSIGNNFYDYEQESLKPVTLNSTFKLHNMIRAGLQWFLFKNGVCASNHFESGGFVKSDPSVSHPDIQMQFVPTAMKEAGSSEIIQHGYQVKLSTVLL